jgi:toxin ParE1/3/4
MAAYELSQAADRDLTEIYVYSFQQFGEAQADAYLVALGECMAQLAEAPRLGRAIDHLRSGYRRFEHQSHVIFYRVVDRGILVVRVLHERMDPVRNL